MESPFGDTKVRDVILTATSCGEDDLDAAFYRELVESFQKTLNDVHSENLAIVKANLEASECRNVGGGVFHPFALVRNTVHCIKGTAANICLSTIHKKGVALMEEMNKMPEADWGASLPYYLVETESLVRFSLRESGAALALVGSLGL